MSWLTTLPKLYQDFRKRNYERRWDVDFEIFGRQNNDPHSLAGLELALLHLSKVVIQELPAVQRRQLTIETLTANVDELLAWLNATKHLVISRNSVPQVFTSSTKSQLRSYDDYFVSQEGHIVSLEKIRTSLEVRVNQLITTVSELEIDEPIQYSHYDRKLRQLYGDAFCVIRALYQTSFR